MKKLALLFACAAGWLAAVGVRAADQPAQPAQGEAATRLQEIAARLELTEDQKDQIAPILQKEIADLKALRDDTSLRRLQRARRAKEIANTTSKQIRALLTPEQQVEYDALRDEMRKEVKKRAKERKSGAGGSSSVAE